MKNNNEDIIKNPIEERMSEFNARCKYRERERLSDLQIDKYYSVENFERLSTKFGPRILTTLAADCEEFTVFLPKRFKEN